MKILAVALWLACVGAAVAQDGAAPELVKPSLANPAVKQFDAPNIVLRPASEAKDVPLAVFMPGTNGTPERALPIMRVIASQGYRVIGLSYDDLPFGAQVCPLNGDPKCLEQFREMRVFGVGPAPLKNSVDESIDGRLIAMLKYLDQKHPEEHWAKYLLSDGQPDWTRIMVTGLSQGAGMAALIAKRFVVYRAVLFSSPWDNYGAEHRPSPWLSEPAKTPMDRWWAARHAKENTTEWLANCYRALGIPKEHLFVFEAPLPEGEKPTGDNPFHSSTIRNPAYDTQWRQMFGTVQ